MAILTADFIDNIKSPNAKVYFNTSGGNVVEKNLWIMEISQGHEIRGKGAQSLLFHHFYPTSYAAGPMKVKGRVPNQAHYDYLGQVIRSHQVMIANNRGATNTVAYNDLALLKLEIPSEGILVEGFIKKFNAGAKRFNPAPEFEFEFEVIRDRHWKSTPVSRIVRDTFFRSGEVFEEELEISNEPDATRAQRIQDNWWKDGVGGNVPLIEDIF